MCRVFGKFLAVKKHEKTRNTKIQRLSQLVTLINFSKNENL